MKRISARQLLHQYLEGKDCVLVYPKTDWLEKEKNNHKARGRLKMMSRKLGGIDWFEIIGHDYFVFEFETKKQAEEFFYSFGYYNPSKEYEEPFYVELYINGECENENT